MDISEKIRQYRKQKNLTQKALAEKLHLSRKTISAWENGRGYPDIKSVTKLSDIFGISVDDFLRDDDLLEHYTEQNKQTLRTTKIAQVSYYLILFFTIISYGNFFNLWDINNNIVSLILFVIISVFLSNYPNWDSFKKNKKSLKVTLAIIFFLILNATLIPLNTSFFKQIKIQGQTYILGMVTGIFIISILLSTCLIIILFFYPQNKQDKKQA